MKIQSHVLKQIIEHNKVLIVSIIKTEKRHRIQESTVPVGPVHAKVPVFDASQHSLDDVYSAN